MGDASKLGEARARTETEADLRYVEDRLRVGAVGPYHVTDMLAVFNARYPGLYVSVTIGKSD